MPVPASSPRLRTNSHDTEVQSSEVPAVWVQQPDVVLQLVRTEERQGLLAKPKPKPTPRTDATAKYGTTVIDLDNHRTDRIEQEQELEPAPHDDGELHAPQWEVVGRVRPCCCWATRVLECVQYRHVNVGLRCRRSRARGQGQSQAQRLEPRREVPSCVMGPQRYFMLTSFTAFSLAIVYVTSLTVRHGSLAEVVVGVLLSGTFLILYAIIGCRNPGILERITTPTAEAYTFCDECQSYRPPGTLHCFECRVCIEECDHHCPWTGKCIGKRNLRLFYMWLGSLALAFVYEMIEFATYMLPAQPLPAHPGHRGAPLM